MNILIVEGNPVAAIEAGRRAGVKPGHVAYREALALHAPQARYDVLLALDDDVCRFDLEAFDGFALTGAGVPWSAGEPEASSMIGASSCVASLLYEKRLPGVETTGRERAYARGPERLRARPRRDRARAPTSESARGAA